MKLLNPKWETVRDDAALLVVDVQERFLSQVEDLPVMKAFVKKVNRAITLAAKCGVPVYVIEYEDCGFTIPVVEDTLRKNGAIIRRVTKNRDDGAWHYRRALVEAGIPEPKKVLVAGLNTEFCVCRTVYGLRAQWDYEPDGRGKGAKAFVLEPACVSTSHNQNVAWNHFEEYHKECKNVVRYKSISKAFRDALAVE